MRRSLCLILLLTALSLRAEKVEEYFRFDPADETIPVTVLENPLFYDAGIAPATNGLWVAWLEFVPGQGDQLWIGLRQGEKWALKTLVSQKQGDYRNYARPTPTIDTTGQLWLTYEATVREDWRVVGSIYRGKDRFDQVYVGGSTGPDINHNVTVHPIDGVWAIWQGGRGGLSGESFQIAATPLPTKDHKNFNLAWHAGNVWHPSVAVSGNGIFHTVWDAYDGDSYNVFLEVFKWNDFTNQFLIASSPAFEARAQIVADKNGKLYVSWEEDGENWGKHYLARGPGQQESGEKSEKKLSRMADNEGPLHRFRKLHFAELDEKNGRLKEYELPQPSFELANQRTNRPAGIRNFGVFYENSQIVVDGQNRPWIVYRHSYVPWIGLVPETHKQDNMRIYARCLLPDGWSKLYAFSEGQGDGMQRIHVAPTTNGIAVAYTIGRTDRRKKQLAGKTGVALAEIKLDKAEVKIPAKSSTRSLEKNVKPAFPLKQSARPAAEVAGKKYELFFGDLHRHTDISLCFSPVDGTIEDAYRYAIDVAPLDFLGITDHTHDLDMGDGLSLIWHRSRKEVNRHALADRFIPFYSYERSRGDTDHNVISLSDKILKPHTYPHPEFWKELDTNTFTIPHQPFNAVTWKYKDDAHRPLMEIYQGFRNDAREEDAKQGLLRGHHFGFIAASDHMSTSASFACVWAEKAERESLFRAMQARRTYAATAKIQLKVTCGEHWMGEQFEVKEMPVIKASVKGAGEVSKVELFVDGERSQAFENLGKSEVDLEITAKEHAGEKLTGPHIFHIRVTQKDGNRAWSSPMWVDIKK